MTAEGARIDLDGEGSFVGRERETQLLEAALARANSGRGVLVLIGGEPGIGKSRLADEFARHARSDGARVLWGRCWEGAGAPAYWPWIQALRSHLRNAAPAEAREQLGPGAVDMAQMLPEIRELMPDLPPPPPESDSARFRLFDSTTAFLRNLARTQATVLVLDDLHAADIPSILLLRFLAGQLADMRMVVLATYRDVELSPSHPLTDALTEIAREAVTRTLQLQGLPEESVGRFIESTSGVSPVAQLVRGMWRETNGNPLFLSEAVRLLAAEGRLGQVLSTETLRLSVPAGVREVIGRRVGQLTDGTVKALTIGAALGPEFGSDIVRRVGGYRPADLLGLLDEAVRAGLLVPLTGALGRFRFSHDLVRESLYQDQSAADRAALHRRIADTLEALYEPSSEARLAELAHHFFEAAQGGDEAEDAATAERAQTYAARAADAAARSLAFEEAARLFRMALAMLDLQASTDDQMRTELLLSIGDAEARAGDMESATGPFVQAAEVARRSGDAAHLALAALGVGSRTQWTRPGRNPHLIPLLEEALFLLGGDDEPLRVRLLARLACAWRSSPEKRQQSETLSRQALDIARRLGDPVTLSYALVGRCWATWWPENPDQRVQLAGEMLAVAQAAGDSERLIDAHLMLVQSYTELGQMAEVARGIAEIRRLAHELREPGHIWLEGAWGALIALMEGEFDLAAQLIKRELASAPSILPTRDNVSAGTLHQFLLAREKGRPAEAEEAVRAAVAEFEWYPLHRAALVLLLLDLGRESEARSLFNTLADAEFRALYRDNEWLLGMSLASEACSLLGDEAAAGVLYEQLAPFAGRHAIGQVEGSAGAVDRYLGLLAATMGRLDDAARHLDAAIALNQQMGAHPWTAHSQHDLALVLRRRAGAGDEQRAAELDRAALTTATTLGMTALVERINPADRRVTEPAPGAPPPPATVFRREGEYWTIGFGDDSFRLRDAKGLHYLARLLAEPNREFLALDLVRDASPAAPTTPAAVRAAQGSQRATDLGDAGVQLDEQAKGAYRERLHELQEELDEAESWNDSERAERAREEMDFLARELARAVGLGGRDRAAGSASERARISVTRAIRLSMTRIGEHSSGLGEHLGTTISTGTYCAYRPDSRVPVNWQQ